MPSKNFPHAATGTYIFDGVAVDVTFDFDPGDPATGVPDCLQVYEVFIPGVDGPVDIADWMSAEAMDRLMFAMETQDAQTRQSSRDDAAIDRYIAKQEEI